VQCNVRGRDIGSFVAEAQAKIASQVDLPVDRFKIEWGGQFENMQRAQQRLMIVVPLALSLIVVLLYMTFRNFGETICVFASVPFASVGGVLGLYYREMPLSISAAVGFITLSGVSVLSSMILVAAKRAAASGPSHTDDRAGQEQYLPTPPSIVAVSVECLRTILMTALVASVGFIPMATSDGTGAEVQRPLATVVIGGVLSSTFFTLLVLPILLQMLSNRAEKLPSPSRQEP
jgi:cobalt-zinc-cadmium resistance protein CzcA